MHALRRHLIQHNVKALGLAAGALGLAGLVWGVLGLAAYWLTLLGATISRGLDPEEFTEVYDARSLVGGSRFVVALVGGALGLIALAALGRRLGWSDSSRERRGYLLFWVGVELLMLAPNLTLSIWGNLRAVVWLRRRELSLAWRLLQAIGQREVHGQPLALSAAGAEVGARAEDPGLGRALLALQLTELIHLRGDPSRGWSLGLSGEPARALCGPPTPAGAS